MERDFDNGTYIVRLDSAESVMWLEDGQERAAWRRDIKRAMRREGKLPARFVSHCCNLLEELHPIGVEQQERVWDVEMDVSGAIVLASVEATAAQNAARSARYQYRCAFQDDQRRGLIGGHLDVPEVRVVSVRVRE